MASVALAVEVARLAAAEVELQAAVAEFGEGAVILAFRS